MLTYEDVLFMQWRFTSLVPSANHLNTIFSVLDEKRKYILQTHYFCAFQEMDKWGMVTRYSASIVCFH